MKNYYYILKEYKHIILGFAHANTLGIIRSMGKEGIKPIVIGIKDKTKNRAYYKSRYIGLLHLVNSYEEGLNYIKSNFTENHKNFLYLMSDAGINLCDRKYEELKEHFYFFNAGSANILSKYMDKGFLCEQARKCNLPVPNFEIVKRGNLPRTLSYPVFIKSRNPFCEWKEDMAICKSEEELLKAQGAFVADEWLIQDYIQKKTEVSIQGISVNGGKQVYMPYIKKYARLRDTDYGTYMYYEINDLSESLQQKICKYLQLVNFSGCFEIEFLQDNNDNLYFLEINFRYSGSNQGMYYGGVNLPLEWAIAEIKGEMSENIKLRNERYYVMNEYLDIKNVLSGKMSLAKFLKDFSNSYKYIYDNKDLKPILYSVIFSFKPLFSKILNKTLSVK